MCKISEDERDEIPLMDFEEVSPSSEVNLDQSFPELSRIGKHAGKLAFQYGCQKTTARWQSILENFPSVQSYNSILGLIEKGFSLDSIVEASKLKSVWQSSPELWLTRYSYRHTKFPLLTWETYARLCSVYDFEEVIDLIFNFWKDEWLRLSAPHCLFYRSINCLCDRDVRNSYLYFSNYVSCQAKSNSNDFPAHLSEYPFDCMLGEDKTSAFVISEEFLKSEELQTDVDGSLWQDPSFSKGKISDPEDGQS